ncbi:hypothetical protein QF041_006237 [Paenibacillus sp. W2I17]|nr:hypothetical protein [Paenibacillus sp. W2I17]
MSELLLYAGQVNEWGESLWLDGTHLYSTASW